MFEWKDMFGMKAKKRVKQLEEQLDTMQEQFVSLQERLEQIADQQQTNIHRFSSIELDVNELRNSTPETGSAGGISKEKLNEFEDIVDKRIKANNEKIINGIKTILSKQTSATPSVTIDYDRIVRQLEERMDSRIQNLEQLYREERQKNEELKKQIAELEKKIPAPIPAAPSVSASSASAAIPVSAPKPNPKLLFTESTLKNQKSLQLILGNARILREKYAACLPENSENSVYFKTIDNCIKKMEKLCEKAEASEIAPSKLVNEIVKILNATIAKNFVKKELYGIIDEFMLNCFFDKIVLEAGHKLVDSDYEYIGDMPLNVPVSDPRQNNVIQSKEHDAYLIFYQDEEGKQYRVIDGKYTIGIYTE